MGQHKHNPTAILAKEGKLPPKEPKMGKPERRRFLQRLMEQELMNRIIAATEKQKAAEELSEETEKEA